MRRRSATTSSASFSLFPFLAVLLCVMGALIVVLVVIARQVRTQAAEAAKARSSELAATKDERETKLADFQWRIDQLRDSRRKTAEQLEGRRLELSHIEDHARALRDQLQELEEAAKKQAAEPSGDDRRAQLRSQLAALTQLVATAESELEKARRAAAGNSTPSYAVVPYEGPNQTRRRPIYIECTSDGVILQPEGIVLTEDDFRGPLGPGNPLASALRAEREYLARNRNNNLGEPGEPYPLLLVRPDGVGAYYAARESMTSWGSDFGYELIEQDWKVEFPAADSRLADATRLAVDEARTRQRQIALAAPRRFAEGERPLFRASPTHGGVVRVGRAGGDGDEFGGRYPRGRGGPFGQGSGRVRAAGGARAGAAGRATNGSSGADVASVNPYESLLDDDPTGNRAGANGNGTTPGGSTGADGKAPAQSDSTTIADAAAIAGDGARSSQTAGDYANALGGDGAGSKPPTIPQGAARADSEGVRRGSQAAPRSPGEKAIAAGSEELSAEGARSAGARETDRAASPRGGRSESASATGKPGPSVTLDPHNAAAAPATGGSPDASVPPEVGVTFGPTAKASLAERRGQNWGLPDAVQSAVPITRPLRIDCRADRLVVRPDDNRLGGGKSVVLGPKTEDSIEELVSIVWEHIDSWGSAGRGMYWRPTLSVDVQPGGEGRFTDLQVLLADSGLDVRARGAGTRSMQQTKGTRQR